MSCGVSMERYISSGETIEGPAGTVCSELSKAGTNVSANDFSAIHRNGKLNKTIQVNGKDIQVPPSITVKLKNLNKKDAVLRGYKNYIPGKSANEKGKPRNIRVYQSLTEYYKALKDVINTKCGTTHPIRWIHWRSPTCGLAVKLKNGRLLTKIHCVSDFEDQMFF